ncbi:NINE protein [Gracilimonas sp. Q87]|uniref:NINE protein n=1 Tax=Gracilimonas sp. Q87 TaxID=3384766 RepID=UPI003983EF6B
MRISEEYEIAIVADQALYKALQKYEEISEVDGTDSRSDLMITIHDSIRNLRRKIDAYLQDKLSMERVIEEFIFEYQVLQSELEIRKSESAKPRIFAKKLMSSYEDFIAKVGGIKKLSIIQGIDVPGFEKKSKAKAYLFWFISFFGIFGFHRFYLGKIGTGIAWILSGGVLGLGALYDLFALSSMVDEYNNYHELRGIKMKHLNSNK